MENKSYKIRTKYKDLYLRVTKGHFATGHSHINYFIDVTSQKTRLSEAKAVAKQLVSYYNASTIVDTVVCLDGTEVIGACLANELTKGPYMIMNAHQTIYVVTPERISGSQLIFRDNIVPMIKGKHVLVLAASVTTGYTAGAAVEAINYYSGHPVGICALFATVDKCAGLDVRAIFDPKDLKDYESHAPHECPMCKKNEPIDALVNSFGYSKLQ